MNEIDLYIATFPVEVQGFLKEIREIIKKEAPHAEECISWGMPTFRQDGNLVHFAGNKMHVGFYPGGSPVEVFKEKLVDYKTSKGAIQFPYNKPFPVDLIAEIIRFRIRENEEIARNKDKSGFLFLIPAPARRALENAKITSLKKLSLHSEEEILKLHGMGKSSIPKLKDVLAASGLAFRNP